MHLFRKYTLKFIEIKHEPSAFNSINTNDPKTSVTMIFEDLGHVWNEFYKLGKDLKKFWNQYILSKANLVDDSSQILIIWSY